MARRMLPVLLLLAAPAAAGAKEGEPTVSIEKADKHLDLKMGKQLVARYHVGPDVPKPYLWPLHAPGGLPVTRGWPMAAAEPGEEKDHVHQKSAWFCHGDVIPEGVELEHRVKNVAGVDFWSEGKGHGKIVCVEVGEPKADKDHAWVTTRNEWRTAGGRKVLDETRTLHLYPVKGKPLVVLDIDLHASVCPVTFGDTKEGSMGVRVRGPMTEKKKGGTLTDADGRKGANAVWGQRSRWNDYSGEVPAAVRGDGAGKVTVGVALFDDSGNDPPACWHSRDYGLMAANPFGRKTAGFPAVKQNTDLVKLEKGKHLKLRYGLLPHDGDAEKAGVAEAYEAFLKLKGK
jgi:Methane oxygenase PmoA